MVYFAPVENAIPYIRQFYDELKVDADPALTDTLSLDGCLWVACSVGSIDCGGFILIPKDDGYEAMTLLVPPARGAVAVRLAREGIALFSSAYPGVRLRASTFSDMRAAQRFIASVGFRRSGSEDEGDTRKGKPCKVVYYEQQV